MQCVKFNQNRVKVEINQRVSRCFLYPVVNISILVKYLNKDTVSRHKYIVYNQIKRKNIGYVFILYLCCFHVHFEIYIIGNELS